MKIINMVDITKNIQWLAEDATKFNILQLYFFVHIKRPLQNQN